MSKEERNLLLAQFLAWDKNGDGVLSREEIFEGYKSLIGEVKAKEESVRRRLTIGVDYGDNGLRRKWCD